MIYQIFFVLAMLLSLALLGLLISAVWRVLAGNRLDLLRRESGKGPAQLAGFLKGGSLSSRLERPGPDSDADFRDTIADAADRDRYLAELTAFSRRKVFRGAAFSLLALAGASGFALAAYGHLRGGFIYLLDGLLLFLAALAAWAILALLAQIHDRYRQTLSILAENLESTGAGMEVVPAADARPSRVVKAELAFFALFLLLLAARCFLIAFLRVDISAVLGFAISFGSFLLLCLGFLAALALLNRKQGKQDGA